MVYQQSGDFPNFKFLGIPNQKIEPTARNGPTALPLVLEGASKIIILGWCGKFIHRKLVYYKSQMRTMVLEYLPT